MTDPENVRVIGQLQPDLMGFIFYRRSLRYVGDHPDPDLFSSVPVHIEKVGVFVNAYYEKIIDITGKFKIGTIQLHGMESPETCNALRIRGKKIIKVIPGDRILDAGLIAEYEQVSDYLLFDTPARSYGGTGRKFDWKNLHKVRSDTPFFLSGGIGPEDSRFLLSLQMEMFRGIDINSRFESAPGIKDPELTGSFIKVMRHDK